MTSEYKIALHGHEFHITLLDPHEHELHDGPDMKPAVLVESIRNGGLVTATVRYPKGYGTLAIDKAIRMIEDVWRKGP